MLEYNRIDVREGIDINKAVGSLEFIICYYWYLSGNILDFNQKNAIVAII